MRSSLFISLLIFVCISCAPTKTTTVDPPVEPGTPDCEEIVYKSDLQDVRKDQFRLLAVSLEGDCLSLDVSYSGGCEGAEFKFFYQTTINKKPPPSVVAILGFTDNDNCRSIVKKTLHYNLKGAQQKGYDSVQILLGGWVQPINYSY